MRAFEVSVFRGFFYFVLVKEKKHDLSSFLNHAYQLSVRGFEPRTNLIKSQVLYHLSYTPLTGVAGLEPAVQESESCALPLGDTPSMRQLFYYTQSVRSLSTVTFFIHFLKFNFNIAERAGSSNPGQR